MSSDWVDFKAVKEHVRMEMVLKHYGIQLRRVNQSYLRGKCRLPTHTSTGGDTLGVNTKKNIWACQSQSCIAARAGKKGGNVLDFATAMEQCSIRDAAIKLAHWFNVPSETSDAPPPARREERSGATQLVAERKTERGVAPHPGAETRDGENPPLTFALKKESIDHAHPYVTNRGITPETAAHLGLGYFSGRGTMSGRVVIPIHNKRGEIVAYAGRSIDDSEPKYKFPNGFRKSLEIYNVHRVAALGRELVIVVEGFFDAAIVHQAGFPSVVALMGSSLSKEQEDAVSEFSKVALMLDGDQAGWEAAEKMAARLMRKTFVKVIGLPDGEQPDELSPEELKFFLGSL